MLVKYYDFHVYRTELTGQLDHMQEDLDGLKDMLSGGQYNFDPSTLLSVNNYFYLNG